MTASWAIAAEIFLHFAMLSLLAIGGGVLSLTPDMLRFMTESHGWLTRAEFVECVSLAQISPGPNFLFATLAGMRAAGMPGAIAATVALVLPPSLLTMATLRFGGRHLDSPTGTRIRRAILPLSIGMMASTAWSMTNLTVASWPQMVAFAVATALLIRTRLNPLWLLAAGAALGAAGIL